MISGFVCVCPSLGHFARGRCLHTIAIYRLGLTLVSGIRNVESSSLEMRRVEPMPSRLTLEQLRAWGTSIYYRDSPYSPQRKPLPGAPQ